MRIKHPKLNINAYFFVRKKFVIIAVLLIVVAGVIYYLTRKEKPQEEYAIVATMKAEQNDVGVYGEYVGRVRAQQFVEVHARVEGFLEQMLFEEGT